MIFTLTVSKKKVKKKNFFVIVVTVTPGPKVIKLFPCSTQLRMKFFPLINVKMPTSVGILTCMSGKNNILGLTEPKKKAEFLDIF